MLPKPLQLLFHVRAPALTCVLETYRKQQKHESLSLHPEPYIASSSHASAEDVGYKIRNLVWLCLQDFEAKKRAEEEDDSSS